MNDEIKPDLTKDHSTPDVAKPNAKQEAFIDPAEWAASEEWIKAAGDVPAMLSLVGTRSLNLLYDDYRKAYKENAALVKHINANKDYKELYDELEKDCQDFLKDFEDFKKATADDRDKLDECTEELQRLAKKFDIPDLGPVENVRGAYMKFTALEKHLELAIAKRDKNAEERDSATRALICLAISKKLIVVNGTQVVFEVVEIWIINLGFNVEGVTKLLKQIRKHYEASAAPGTYSFVEKAK